MFRSRVFLFKRDEMEPAFCHISLVRGKLFPPPTAGNQFLKLIQLFLVHSILVFGKVLESLVPVVGLLATLFH